ncbi:Ku protein [Vallicoccus soli]|uniref:Non-homologous end joining protein Ku n=1 Tax=Vallicoccus soli TaxID=2339232 RepID=A0A3A3ZAH2_9ACTN|nr:Ku protein [Vallicoccus soli]RJK98086.1 Ku protein [Vallicoccus soli]
MQTIWKGSVSFGLVSIPVRLYSATEERDVSFRQVHREDGGRVRYKRVCELDGEEVQYRDIAKGYEMPDGEMVVLERQDFESLPLTSSRVIDVLQFVPREQLDPLMVAKSYYLSADGPGAKPYVLLRDALSRTDRVAVVKVALRNREQLAALSTRGDVMVLQTMLWPDEVRDAGGLAPDEDITVRDQEVAMAESYIETLTGDFDPSEFTDGYRKALEELIQSKATGAPVEAPEEAPAQDGNVVDLMAALRASVEAAKARRAGGAAPAQAAPAAEGADADADADADAEDEAPAPRKRAAARGSAVASKSPAKRAAATEASAEGATAKKATAKKATARKAPAKTTTAKSAAKKAAAQEPAAKRAPARKAQDTAAKAPAKRATRKSA